MSALICPAFIGVALIGVLLISLRCGAGWWRVSDSYHARHPARSILPEYRDLPPLPVMPVTESPAA